MSTAVSPHVKAVRYVEHGRGKLLVLTRCSGLSTDGLSDLPSIGLYSGIYGAAKLSTFVPSSMPTETSMIQGDRGYAAARRLLCASNGRLIDSQILFNETEKLLDKWKHPDPYRPPTAPGGMTRSAGSSQLHRKLTTHRLEI